MLQKVESTILSTLKHFTEARWSIASQSALHTQTAVVRVQILARKRIGCETYCSLYCLSLFVSIHSLDTWHLALGSIQNISFNSQKYLLGREVNSNSKKFIFCFWNFESTFPFECWNSREDLWSILSVLIQILYLFN